MSSSSSKKSTKLSDLVDQAENIQGKRNTRTVGVTETKAAPVDERFAKIEANTFKKILWNPELSPEQKKEAVAKVLAFSAEESKEANREKLAELELFKEWLQLQRKEMSQKLISLTDTEAFSELKMVYDDINSALMDFDGKMQPLTDIVDAVFDLRMAGGDVIFDIFKEIKDDQAEEEKRLKLKQEQESKLSELEDQIYKLNKRKSSLAEEKSFFGLGGVTQEARQAIAQIEQVDLVKAEQERLDLQADIESINTLSNRPLESKYTDLLKQKATLKSLLDISSDQHKERQQDLVNAANNFVDTTEKRVGEVMKHLSGRNQHIEGVAEMNDSMESIYTVLREAEKDAEGNNQNLRGTLTQDVEKEESAIAKMQKEKQLRSLEEHITALDTVSVDTGTTLAELSNASFQIKSMKDSNQQQMAKTRGIQSSGVAGVAQRLATTLDALSGAALNEASEMTSMSLSLMNDKTNRTIAKDALRRASGIKDQSDSLTKAIDDLAAMGQVIRKASDITRENVRAVKERIGGLEEVTKEIQRDVNASYGINADVGAEVDGAPKKEEAEKPKDGNTGGGMGGFNL